MADTRLPYQARLDDITLIYEQAQARIVAQIQAAIARGAINSAKGRRAQLFAVMNVLDDLGRRTDPAIRALVQQAFFDAGERTAGQIDKLKIKPGAAFRMSGVNVDALRALEDSLSETVHTARVTVGRQVNDVYARAQRQAAIEAVTGSHPSPGEAAKGLRARLASEGVTGFVDKSGRRWTMDNYTQMAMRTITREAVTMGAASRMAAHGIDLARVPVHPKPCPICEPFQGRLISLNGSRTTYRGEAVLQLTDLPEGKLPPWHPQCEDVIAPVSAKVDQMREQMGVL